MGTLWQNVYRLAVLNDKNIPSWKKFDIILEAVGLDVPIGHLFVFYIGFEKQTAKTLV